MVNSPQFPQRYDNANGTAQRPAPLQVVAVTGIHSAIGAALLAFLVEESRVCKVLCIDVTPPALSSPKLAFESADLTSLDVDRHLGKALAEHHVDSLAHLAFRDAPSASPGYSHELESIGTMRVVQACLTGRVKKLVMASRTWLYGANPGLPALLDEHQPLRARRSERYFADKIDAEQDVLAFRAPGRGRFSTILRMAPVVDPRRKSHVVRLLSDRFVPSILGFDPMWQLTHIEDAARAVSLALFRDAPAVVNISSTGAVPLSVARNILGAQHLALPRFVSSVLLSGIWLSGFGRIPPSELDYLQYPCVADCSLSRTALGFSPAHNTLSILKEAAHLPSSETES